MNKNSFAPIMIALWEKLKIKWHIESDKRMAWIFIIFAITGSSVSLIRKPVTKWLFQKTTFSSLAWYEFIITFVIVYIIYQILLFTIGSLLGEHQFVKWFVIKMNKRIFPFIGPKA
jgi:manganese efflux pump family protein